MANLFTRPDTFFGVCEGVGRDLGLHPNLLRVAFAVTVLWQPLWALAAYLALGAVVLATRLLAPEPAVEAAPAAEPAAANDAAAPALAEAA